MTRSLFLKCLSIFFLLRTVLSSKFCSHVKEAKGSHPSAADAYPHFRQKTSLSMEKLFCSERCGS